MKNLLNRKRKKHISDSKQANKQLRVFVGLIEISGYYGRIVSHLRSEGYPISFREISPHRFDYNHSSELLSYRYVRYLDAIPGEPWSFMPAIRRRLFGLHFIYWAVTNHDVFVFVYGQSFNRFNLDLILLRLMRKRVVSSIWHGSEARPGYMDGAIWSLALRDKDPVRYVYKFSLKQQRQVRRLQFLSTDIIAHPLNSQFLTKDAINATSIGIPPPASSNQITIRNIPTYPLRIVHVPSDRAVKGSDRIKQIVEDIKSDLPGLLEYQEIHGVTNQVVLEILSNSDLLIDQLYSDTVWSGVGVEAANLSLPVVLGNVNLPELKKFVKPQYFPPAFVTSPENFEVLLREVVIDPYGIQTMGMRAKVFVDNNWDVKLVAIRFMRAITGQYDNDFAFDPLSVQHIFGGGISTRDLTAIWAEGYKRFGKKFFSLHRRPDLMKFIFQQLLQERQSSSISQ